MIRALSAATMDVPPYLLVIQFNRCAGVSIIGLRRAGFTPE